MLRLTKWWWVSSLKFSKNAWFFLKFNLLVLAPFSLLFVKIYYSKVENMVIEGRERLDSLELLKYLDIKIKEPLFKHSIKILYDKLTQMPWIYSVCIYRQLPNKLLIRLVERYPDALWQNPEGQFLIDNEGQVIAKINLVDKKMLDDLKIIRGHRANLSSPFLIRQINCYPLLVKKFVAATWVQNRRWNILFNSGVIVKFSEHHLSENLEKLNKLELNYKILTRDIISIDMRSDHVIVEKTPQDIQPSPIKNLTNLAIKNSPVKIATTNNIYVKKNI